MDAKIGRCNHCYNIYQPENLAGGKAHYYEFNKVSRELLAATLPGSSS
jgi:hypothetical protein